MKMTVRERVSAHQGAVVLRDVDAGWKSFFWLVPFDGRKLEEWWTSQETFGELSDKPPPPAKLHPPGRFLRAMTDNDFALWEEMSSSKRHYYCNLCCDYDSFLQRPDGTLLYHKGYTGKRRDRQ